MLTLNIYKSAKDIVSQIVYSFIEQISVKCVLQVDTRLGTEEIRTNHKWFLCKRITTHEQILCFIANYTRGAGVTNYMGRYHSHGKRSRGDTWAMNEEEFASIREAERKQHKQIHRNIKRHNIQEKRKHLCMVGI